MPDPTVSDALAEAYALASAEEIVHHTLEVRHPLFADGSGNPDSLFIVANDEDLLARVEHGAAVKAGQLVRFRALPFRFSLPPIEPGATPELELAIDNVGTRMVELFDLAMTDQNPITICYRPYLASDPSGPQMLPPPIFTLSEVKVTALMVTARARTGVGDALRRRFPRRLYTAREFPGLIGR